MIIILRRVQKILGGVKKTMEFVCLLLSLLSMEKQASTSLVVCIFNKKYSPLLITQTLANSYLALEPKSLSSGFWSFTTILPWITGTLDQDNLNPQKTGSNNLLFLFLFGSFSISCYTQKVKPRLSMCDKSKTNSVLQSKGFKSILKQLWNLCNL